MSTFTLTEISDNSLPLSDSIMSSDDQDLYRTAARWERQGKRVKISEYVDGAEEVVYLSPSRRTELERSYREAPATMEQIRMIRELLVERDLIAETRPAYRRRMQQIKSDMSILDTLTFEQASALWDALLVLPVSDDIDHIAFVNALYGEPETAYEQRCAQTIGTAYGDGMCALGWPQHMTLMSFTY